MCASENRGRITLRPLDTDRALAEIRKAMPPPRGWKALAEMPDKPGDDGWLVRCNRNGALAIWMARGGMRSINQRKARAALAELGDHA